MEVILPDVERSTVSGAYPITSIFSSQHPEKSSITLIRNPTKKNLFILSPHISFHLIILFIIFFMNIFKKSVKDIIRKELIWKQFKRQR